MPSSLRPPPRRGEFTATLARGSGTPHDTETARPVSGDSTVRDLASASMDARDSEEPMARTKVPKRKARGRRRRRSGRLPTGPADRGRRLRRSSRSGRDPQRRRRRPARDQARAGAARVKRVVYPPGFRWSVDMKPEVGTDLCMHGHVGFLASGAIGSSTGRLRPRARGAAGRGDRAGARRRRDRRRAGRPHRARLREGDRRTPRAAGGASTRVIELPKRPRRSEHIGITADEEAHDGPSFASRQHRRAGQNHSP